MAKKLKVGLRVSRLLVSGSLGPTVVGHGGKGDFYCTKSGLGLRTDKSPIVNWELFFLLSNYMIGLIETRVTTQQQNQL